MKAVHILFIFEYIQYSLFGKLEDKTFMREKSQTPGPANYEVKVDLVKERSFTFKIGKSIKHHNEVDKNPVYY